MGVSTKKIGGKPPKWMVKIMENPENPIKMGWFGDTILFGNIPFCREFFVEEKNKKQSSCGPCFYREIHLIQDSAVLKFLPNRWKKNTPLLEWTPKRVLFFFRVITCVFLLQEILAHVFLVSKDSACKVDRCHLILIFCIKFTSLLSFAFHLVGSNNTSTRNRNQPTKTKKKIIIQIPNKHQIGSYFGGWW